MIYLLWDKDNIVLQDGEKGSVVKPDDPVLKKRKADYRIAILTTTPQVVKALPLEVEDAAIRNFPGEYKTCFEQLKEPDEWQVFGSPNTVFDEIKNAVLPENIEALIPYPVAIRSLLQRDAIPPEEHVIVLDDDSTKIIFTVFHDNAATSPRIISRESFVREFNQAREDYIREEKGFGIDFRVVTNNAELKEQLAREKAADSALIALWGMTSPVIEGLKICGPSVQFVLFEQTQRKKLRKQRQKALAAACVSAALAAGSAGFCLSSLSAQRALKNRINHLASERAGLQGRLLEAYQQKYPEIIRSQQDDIPAGSLAKLFKYAPTGYRIEHVNIKSLPAGGYEVVAFVIPQVMTPDDIRTVFPEAFLADTVIRGVNAFRVSYGIDDSGKEFSFTTRKGRGSKR